MDRYAESSTLNSAPRLGLLGGTFDPIHNAHIQMACLAKEKYKLDHIYFIVAKDSPFKEDVVLDPQKRFELVEQALETYPSFTASRLELDRPGKSYSYLTVKDFKQEFPKADLFWIMGVDAFNSLAEWKEFEFLKNNLQFIVFNRAAEINLPTSDIKVFYIKDFDLPISSTQLRAKSKKGIENEAIPENIRAKVLEYYCKN